MERRSDGVRAKLDLLSPGFFLDAIFPRREAADVMRRFAIALTPCLFLVSLACAEEPLPPNAFMTVGSSGTQTTTASETSGDSMETNAPEDLPGDGDGDDDPGDGDADPTTEGDGDADPTTEGDGDADPTTDSGDPVCGNGVVDDGEQCDGGNLGGFTCVDLGYSGGTLACDPVTCTYDASACVTDMDGGSGTSG
jgi:hypothetical protein